MASTQGAAVIETALTFPLLLVLLLNAANYGVYIYDWITLDNAARASAQYQIYNGSVVGAPAIPTIAALEQMVCTDALFHSSSGGAPNCNGSFTVEVCNDQGTCSGNGVSFTPPQDPESSLCASSHTSCYTLWAVKLRYTFNPLFPSTFSLLSNGTIERQVFMRSMQ